MCTTAYSDNTIPVSVKSPLNFKDTLHKSEITKGNLGDLITREVWSNGSEGVVLSSGNGKKIAHNCSEYWSLKENGGLPFTTYDITQESFFKSTCSTLKILKIAEDSKASYLPARLSLDTLPVSLLPIVSTPDQHGITPEMVSMNDVGSNRTKVVNAPDGTWEVEFDGGRVLVTELLRGDLDGDGIEDLLVSLSHYAIEGTYRHYSRAVLSRGKNEKVMSQKELTTLR